MVVVKSIEKFIGDIFLSTVVSVVDVSPVQNRVPRYYDVSFQFVHEYVSKVAGYRTTDWTPVFLPDQNTIHGEFAFPCKTFQQTLETKSFFAEGWDDFAIVDFA